MSLRITTLRGTTVSFEKGVRNIPKRLCWFDLEAFILAELTKKVAKATDSFFINEAPLI